MAVKTFIYSKQQQDELKKVYGRFYTFGRVIVNGQKKIYTDIISDISKCRFSDAKELLTAELSTVIYTKPSRG